jgi:TRAP-type C4-dicarboxylate transport system permease small subunit
LEIEGLMENRVVTNIYDKVKKVNSVCATLAGLVLLFITFSIFVDVFFRYFLKRPSIWVTEVSSYLFLYLIFLATSYTLQQGVHIRVTFLLDLFSARIKRSLGLIASLFAIIFCLVLFWQTSLLTWEAFRDDWIAPTMLSVHYYYIYIVMVFGSFLLFLTSLLKAILYFIEPKPEKTE